MFGLPTPQTTQAMMVKSLVTPTLPEPHTDIDAQMHAVNNPMSTKDAMFVAKGSLFLGKMTNLADGMSVLVESAGVD